VGRDDNTVMKGVTGGGAPAVIWRDFMTAALPRLKTQAIPGGVMTPPPVQAPASDPIGDLLSGSGPGTEAPPEKAPVEDIPVLAHSVIPAAAQRRAGTQRPCAPPLGPGSAYRPSGMTLWM
jgi:membrane peptidoglycan carboxypeptidase